MDQLHRPAVHDTYHESLRLVTGRSFALSLTRIGRFKFFIPVFDIQLGPGLFYQAFTVFNLFYSHVIIRMIPILEGGKPKTEGEMTHHTADWHIISHRWFKFLHGPLSRRLYRLNARQNPQDTPIRIRRAELRRKGYRFGSDEPDFLNSNILTDHVIPPRLVGVHRISLKGIDPLGLNRVGAGSVELLVRRTRDQGITVWPAVCPHEGGPLELGQVCNGTIICPWHNLKQVGATLTPDRPKEFLTPLELSLEGDELVVQERE
jgi:nitrite reductase/ring-hydroxylating ferredoxin subunit